MYTARQLIWTHLFARACQIDRVICSSIAFAFDDVYNCIDFFFLINSAKIRQTARSWGLKNYIPPKKYICMYTPRCYFVRLPTSRLAVNSVEKVLTYAILVMLIVIIKFAVNSYSVTSIPLDANIWDPRVGEHDLFVKLLYVSTFCNNSK